MSFADGQPCDCISALSVSLLKDCSLYRGLKGGMAEEIGKMTTLNEPNELCFTFGVNTRPDYEERCRHSSLPRRH